MIIDAHTHMPSESWPHTPHEFREVAPAVAYMKAAGIDAALFNTWQGVFAANEEDLHQANADALRLAECYPGFLYPGAAVHPAYLDASREWLSEFRRRGYLWVGELVPPQSSSCYADEAGMELWAECAAGGHILQLHVHEDLITLARQFPTMPIVCSHVNLELLSRLALEPNMLLDISGMYGGLVIGAIEKAVSIFGTERVLFGTDFTGYEPRAFLVRLQAAVPHVGAQEHICWRNITELLARRGSRPING